MDRINKVGIELEGGWTKARSPKNPVHDGSVKLGTADIPLHYIGETVSPPLDITLIGDWINSNIPDYVNETCGVHVHISTKSDSDYMALMSSEFEVFFHNSMKEFGKRMEYSQSHPFWERLEGSNPFCARDFRPDEQAIRTDKRGPRYSQLNYCYSLHGTLECRLFPGSTDPGEVYSFVMAFLECVNKFLMTEAVKKSPFDKTYEIWENEILSIEHKQPVRLKRSRSAFTDYTFTSDFSYTTASTGTHPVIQLLEDDILPPISQG